MQTVPVQLLNMAGCKRDGTRLDNDSLGDNQWSRVFLGRPKSMGGYSRITDQIPGICRGMNTFYSGGYIYVSLGSSDALTQTVVDANSNLTGISTRTPAAFVTSSDNLWQFDYIYDVTSSLVRVVAHAAPNLSDISSTTSADVWYGEATAATVLTTTGSSVSGGVVCLQPYLFTFGTAGVLNWSVPNKPNDFSGTGSGTARIGAMKIIKGMPIRGGAGNAPSGLFWSLDSVIRASFVGGTTIFNFDTFTNEASILSSQSVIEYDGVYYWAGVDRFMSFNGVVREVPNDFNLSWFYDNLNFQQRQKVFAMKFPRWGEIWWCYPRGNATECTHAVILNVREKRPDGMPVWYDTVLPNSGRSCGHEAQVLQWPLMAGVDLDSSDMTKLWRHEFGNDELDGVDVSAILKFYTTAELNFLTAQQPQNKAMVAQTMEPDYAMTGGMSVQMIGRANARSPYVEGTQQDFIADDGTGVTSENQLVQFPIKETEQRLMAFKFSSNTQGGSYFAGKTILHVGDGGTRMKS